MAVDVYFAFDGRAGDEGEEEWGYTPVQKMTASRFDSTKKLQFFATICRQDIFYIYLKCFFKGHVQTACCTFDKLFCTQCFLF